MEIGNSEVFRTPPIPEKFNKTYKSRHYSEPDKVYLVNLFTLSCTCPDFGNRASRYSKGDVRIICIHLLDKLKYTKLYKTYDSLTANLIHCSAYFNDNIFLRTNPAGYEIILSFSAQSKWVNVHTAPQKTSTGNIVRFGYNLENQMWQYEEPKHAKQIEQYIINLFRP